MNPVSPKRNGSTQWTEYRVVVPKGRKWECTAGCRKE